MTATAGEAAVAARSYLSSHYLWAAGHFAQLAQQIEDRHNGRSKFCVQHRAYVMSAVLTAVAFLEGAINEFFQNVDGDDHTDYPGHRGGFDKRTLAALAAYWRQTGGKGSILEKYQAALAIAGKSTFERGASPFQDADLLIRLRNRLVHFCPETVSSADAPRKLEKQLRDKFLPNKLITTRGNPYFPDKCLGADCARWATATVRAFEDDACARLGVKPNYQRVGWDAEGQGLMVVG